MAIVEAEYRARSVASEFEIREDVRWYIKKNNGPAFHAVHGNLPAWSASTHFLFLSILAKLLKLTTEGSRHEPEKRIWAENMLKPMGLCYEQIQKLHLDLMTHSKSSIVAMCLDFYTEASSKCDICIWYSCDAKRPVNLAPADDVKLYDASIAQVFTMLRQRFTLAIHAVESSVPTSQFDNLALATLQREFTAIDRIYQSMPLALKPKLEPMSAPLEISRPLSAALAPRAKLSPPMSQPFSYAAVVKKTEK